MNLETFSMLQSVPVHYDRYDEQSGFGYGSRGKPFKPRATPRMIRTLEDCFKEIFSLTSSLGSPEIITSAGAWVNKPGYHGRGEAFDLDGIFWSSAELIAIEYPIKPHLYLALESKLRKYFGTVLSYSYDARHNDHFHMDLGSNVRFEKMSKSRVFYLQNTLFYIHGYQLGLDGVWGPETQSITNEVLSELGIHGGIFNKSNWVDYLDITAIESMKLV
ncbi:MULTISPECIES: extensin family protein [Vibrio]|uniref:extensin family protein n=1 Tax=Vibrio TaxID=662 RepID=UPI00280F584C|nr:MULTISPECIES: extensin family protein [unclassified Vibrio]ELB2875803.1 extensin family protein [Vibrio alginolyticus]MDW1582855.1 extensin family protein [Vibrio sp. Vb2897]MDW1588220.1 extensin family protein [Vibrio sp. Vb2910]MDW1597450.1 extensin family protein [Vibrio sp. Vb2911]MDW1641116.1 extensin family protein [Vibrio sp. Vb2896]